MSQYAIIADQISKKYQIGSKQDTHRTLRDLIADSFFHPLKRLKGLLSGKISETTGFHQTFWALQSVSFQIKPGEAVGIIGNNGAGKSTLLKVLSRITDPTEGRATINGRLGALLEVGTGFHPELTGRENIFLNGAILGMGKQEIRRKFDDIVAFAEIEKFLDTPIKHYSSGMYVRLAFSVAAHLEPEILVVDEVLAVGDVRFQKKCLGKMDDVVKTGRTILFVSHNISALRSLCKRGIFLDQGQVKKDGSIKEVLDFYLNAFQSGDKGIMRWDEGSRPGNGAIKILSIELINKAGKRTDTVFLSEDFSVRILYEILTEGSQACFSLTLLGEEGGCIFSSLNNSEEKFYGNPLKRGIYLSECKIYGNLLNNGKFYLTLVGLSANWSEPFILDRVLSFEAIDDGVLKRDYFGGFGGVVRPQLVWTTQKEE